MNYHQALAYLDSLQVHKIKLGLDSMRSFLDRVGSPEKKLRCVHVAGTNGKGSVCATLAAIAGRAGYRVGLYTSPHLSDVRERFRLHDRFITEEEFAGLATRIREVLEPERITYFEFCTALALLLFAEADLDLVVLETGLGGRLDATNVITPLISVITSVSMDHEAYLGTTLTEVAGEKAGIIKPNVPVISSATAPEAAAVIERVSRERQAPLYALGRDFDFFGDMQEGWQWRGVQPPIAGELTGLRCALKGRYQQQNSAVAVAVALLLGDYGFKIGTQAIEEGLASVFWPGRMEYFHADVHWEGLSTEAGEERMGRWFLLDGAHNPDGVKKLAESLAADFGGRRVIAVWGAMSDKDVAGALAAIVPLVDTLILTRPSSERSATPEQLMACLPPAETVKASCVADVDSALARAYEVSGPDDLIVVAGSLYLVGAARKLLCGEVVGG
jgi:dihydrofolate synthase/folylpolyglutamate synthase